MADSPTPDRQLSIFELLERPSVDALLKADQIFETEDYRLFTRLTEDDRYERKSTGIQGNALAVYLSAFGNGPAIDGGVVAIGVSDTRKIEGCKRLPEPKLQDIERAGSDRCSGARYTTRRLAATNEQGEEDFIILLRVYYVEDRLVELTDGSAYVRRADTCKVLNEHDKAEIRINKGERAFELEVCGLSYPNDFKIDQIRRFCKTVRERRDGSDEVTDEQILEGLHLGRSRDGYFVPNNACALVFARDPQQLFPGAYVHFLRYTGTVEGSGKDYNVIKDRVIPGTVLDIIKETSSVIDANIREFTQYKDGKFYSIPEYPRDAWYELLVNACVHRSYNIRNTGIFVKMFDDHVIVESPGGFMPQVTPQNIYETHRPRNPFLMLVLREFGEVRCINEGTKRIRKEMLEAKLPQPEFYQETSTRLGVRAVLRNDIANRTNSLDSEAYKAIGEAVAFMLNIEEKRIINYVIENHKINVSEALRIMKTTYWHKAKGVLDGLTKRGILEFKSTKLRDPNGHYVLRNSNGTS